MSKKGFNQMDIGRPYYGIGLFFSAGFFTVIIGVLVQFTKDRIFMDVMGLSQVVRIFIISPLIVFRNVKFIYERRTILLTSLRCLTGALGDTFLYYSYTLLPVGDATAICSTNSVFAEFCFQYPLYFWCGNYFSTKFFICFRQTSFLKLQRNCCGNSCNYSGFVVFQL
ncbi:uncharacterized protein LOC111088554 [Limulus polyphemus]|uniref:Uncharacterized protein LOC111088554 n=1 Tax=Limulus polyphemus TaxID=6850 RepID=A0ABM1TFT6_LIMPO|nr:uncharacterized protein LOC111088554 [Limulus polyphemus]